MSRASTRADDERLLSMLALRSAGQSSQAIGNRYGIRAEYVRVSTNRVRADDEAHSGAPLRGYW